MAECRLARPTRPRPAPVVRLGSPASRGTADSSAKGLARDRESRSASASNDLDHPLADESEHISCRRLAWLSVSRPCSTIAPIQRLQFVVSLVPLPLDDHHSEVGMGEQRSSPHAEQLGDSPRHGICFPIGLS
jgi:hypothetical protein